MYVRTLVLVAFLVATLGGVAFADDKDDIMALINKYCELQGTGDIMGQANMMTADRIFINGGVRLTDQAVNIKQQQASQEVAEKRDPGRQVIVVATDPIIRVYGNTAVASFYWHMNNIWSAEYLDKRVANPPSFGSSFIATQVLIKEAGTWKIAHTHLSPYGG